jgi:hypothetical protein
MTATGVAAVASGSSRGNLQSIENLKKGRWIPAAFSLFLAPADGRENPAALLDIGGSLC